MPVAFLVAAAIVGTILFLLPVSWVWWGWLVFGWWEPSWPSCPGCKEPPAIEREAPNDVSTDATLVRRWDGEKWVYTRR